MPAHLRAAVPSGRSFVLSPRKFPATPASTHWGRGRPDGAAPLRGGELAAALPAPLPLSNWEQGNARVLLKCACVGIWAYLAIAVAVIVAFNVLLLQYVLVEDHRSQQDEHGLRE
jgi:hypothetical protein